MLTVVIQAGGESRRMGRDKALALLRGQPLIERVARRVWPIADEILITGNRPGAYDFLGHPVIPDLLPGRGALGGLYTALSAARGPLVAVVACDMAFVHAGLLAAQRDFLLEQTLDAVVPQTTDGYYEPFHAVYRREPCLAAIQAALDAGQKRADSWFPKVNLAFFSPAQWSRWDPQGAAFINLNTPEDLALAEARAALLDD